MRLSGKTAVVVGTGPNIGAGIAVELAKAGAAVVCMDKRADYAELAAADVEATGQHGLAIECDATSGAQVANAVAEIVEALGPVHILVNGAAVFNFKGLREMTLDEWTNQVKVLLNSAFLVSKHVVEVMVEHAVRGSIINLISTAGHQGEPGNIAYSTCKGGLLNFTRSLAMELARDGIRVNSLTPTSTSWHEGVERAKRWDVYEDRMAAKAAEMDVLAQRVPMGILPGPSDYGAAVVFLASDDAAMVTGIDLRVDAGAVAKYWKWDPSRDDR
jgi:NAD(P)-dependent dehydrogenase (short-subunit alcohol dehydrogenase family)